MNIHITRAPNIDGVSKRNVAESPILLEILEILQVMNERIEEQDNRIDSSKGSIVDNFTDDKDPRPSDLEHMYKNQQGKSSNYWDRENEYARSIMRLKALLDGEEQPSVPRDTDLCSLSKYSQAEKRVFQFNLVGNAEEWIGPTPPTPPFSEHQVARSQAPSVALPSANLDIELDTNRKNGKGPDCDTENAVKVKVQPEYEQIRSTVPEPNTLPRLSSGSSRTTNSTRKQTLPARSLSERVQTHMQSSPSTPTLAGRKESSTVSENSFLQRAAGIEEPRSL